ncbi:hypothetical protein UFOVP240_201 [uncultured Caudovirales phage]|uniref:Tail fiber protein n=1 Tax=uncultured Caudovirales phage TaxID=2100421 RepID=A0A6J7WXK6_9CAUD|nr:hypothetical protein UFOVP240_201 [uncultured Caudovirales phage]
MPIIYRSTKGSPLSISEADGNFSYLNDQLVGKLDSTSYTAADVLAKLLTVDGSGSGLDADKLDGLTSATANTVSTIVARDASGNFSAGTITASLTGNVTGNVTGNLTGTVTGNATNVSGVVAVVNGGTGVSDVAAIKTLLSLGTMSTQAAGAVAITGGTITGLSSALPIASGGTGGTTVDAAKTALGLVIGTHVQAQSAILTGLSAIASNSLGILVRNANGTATVRSLAVGTGLSVSNEDGVSGNPTISLASNIALAGTPTAATAASGTNTTQLATTAFVKTAVDTSATTITNYVDNSIASVAAIANATNKVKAYVNFDFSTTYNYQTGLYGTTISINSSLGVTAVTYQGIYSGNNTNGVYMFRVTLNNGVVSNGDYIVSGATNQLTVQNNTLFSILNVNTTRFDVYAYVTSSGGNIRAMVVA